MNKKYSRDMIGYGSKKFEVRWPNNARIALQIVLNYEEGAESCVLHGDKTSEVFLSEIIGAQPIKGRHINMESFYEYGSRRGFWRVHELFQEKKIPITIFGVGMALEKNREVCDAINEAGGKFMVSYDNRDEIRDMYRDYNIHDIRTKYAGAKSARSKIFTELVIMNYSPTIQGTLWKGGEYGR